MKRLLNLFFTRHFFSERILFLAICGGMLLDGWISAVFTRFSPEVLMRIVISLLSGAALAYTYHPRAVRAAIRRMAYAGILVLVSFATYLNIIHHFAFDDALTFLGVYIICSIYFRKLNELVYYLCFGFAMACIAVLLVESPQIVPQTFLLRIFLGSVLVLGLSHATRQFQEQIQQFSKKMVRENKSLNETRIALENRLTHEHLLALVASSTNTVVIISNADDIIEWVNPRFSDVTGYSPEEVIGKSPDILRGPDTDPETKQRIDQMKNRLESFHETILNYRKDGKPVWMRMHVTPLLDENGKLERFIAIQEDISDIKRTEQDLIRSREQLSAAQKQAKIGSWEWTDGSTTFTISEEMGRITGIGAEGEIPISLIMDRIHPDDVEVMRKSIENGLRRRSQFEIEFRLMVNGVLKYVYLTAQVVSVKNERTEKLIGTLQDITQRKNIEREMQLAERQYRSLFENSQHMICMHDLEGTILSINPAGAHAIGFEPEEIIGHSIKKFFYAFADEEYNKYMQNIRTAGSAQGILRLRVNNGVTTIWMYSNILLTGQDGQPFVLSSNVEITNRFEMEKELRKAKRTAEDALVMKDRFVANISHELRTPMNAIVGFTELLLKTQISKEQEEYLQAVHIAGNNLTTMINDVLDLAKIEAGKIEFDAKPFSVNSIMSDTYRVLSQQAIQRGLKLTWECSPDVPTYLLGDELRLTQVLINLVGNAVKFTERGYVHFSCSVQNETEESLELNFMIEDSGIGIPEEKLATIFEPFTQGSAESTRKYGGTGLGLSIVQDLVELQGGQVSVRSATGIGSCFTAIIPYKKVSTEVIQQVEQALQPVEAPGFVRVLIVEDQPLNQQLAQKLIRDFGFASELSVNGKAALDILRSSTEPFDVILMDLQMPEMDGYDTTRIIREKLRLTTPIIALTAHSSAGEREKCLDLGMNDYLVKPFRAQELYFKIASVIRKQLKVQSEPVPETESNEKPLRTLAAGDKKFEREMLGMLLRAIPEDYELIVESAGGGNLTKAKSVAHRLKSSVALAGDKVFSSLLEELEHTIANGADAGKITGLLAEMKTRVAPMLAELKKDFEETVDAE